MARFLTQALAERNIPTSVYRVDLPVVNKGAAGLKFRARTLEKSGETQTSVDQRILCAIAEFVDGLVVPAD